MAFKTTSSPLGALWVICVGVTVLLVCIDAVVVCAPLLLWLLSMAIRAAIACLLLQTAIIAVMRLLLFLEPALRRACGVELVENAVVSDRREA